MSGHGRHSGGRDRRSSGPRRLSAGHAPPKPPSAAVLAAAEAIRGRSTQANARSEPFAAEEDKEAILVLFSSTTLNAACTQLLDFVDKNLEKAAGMKPRTPALTAIVAMASVGSQLALRCRVNAPDAKGASMAAARLALRWQELVLEDKAPKNITLLQAWDTNLYRTSFVYPFGLHLNARERKTLLSEALGRALPEGCVIAAMSIGYIKDGEHEIYTGNIELFVRFPRSALKANKAPDMDIKLPSSLSSRSGPPFNIHLHWQRCFANPAVDDHPEQATSSWAIVGQLQQKERQAKKERRERSRAARERKAKSPAPPGPGPAAAAPSYASVVAGTSSASQPTSTPGPQAGPSSSLPLAPAPSAPSPSSSPSSDPSPAEPSAGDRASPATPEANAAAAALSGSSARPSDTAAAPTADPATPAADAAAPASAALATPADGVATPAPSPVSPPGPEPAKADSDQATPSSTPANEAQRQTASLPPSAPTEGPVSTASPPPAGISAAVVVTKKAKPGPAPAHGLVLSALTNKSAAAPSEGPAATAGSAGDLDFIDTNAGKRTNTNLVPEDDSEESPPQAKKACASPAPPPTKPSPNTSRGRRAERQAYGDPDHVLGVEGQPLTRRPPSKPSTAQAGPAQAQPLSPRPAPTGGSRAIDDFFAPVHKPPPPGGGGV